MAICLWAFFEVFPLMLPFSYGSVTISNEQNFTFGKYCGRKIGKTVLVSGDYAIITFHFSGRGRGFILRFNTVPIGT